MMSHRRVGIGAAAFLWLSAATAFSQQQGPAANPAPAAEPAGPGAAAAPSRVDLDWAMFKKITGFDETRAAAQGVTLPWSEVQDLLGVQVANVSGAKVELSWQEFRALLEWSLQQKPGGHRPPPADYVISGATYKGELSKDAAAFTLEMKVQVLREGGWKRIPILPAGVAVRSAKLPEGAHLNVAGGFYELLTEKSGEMAVTIEFAAAVAEQAGIRRVAFPRVPSSTGVLDLAVDQKDADVKIDRAQAITKKTEGERTLVLAALPSEAAVVSVAWERAIPEAEKVPPKIFSETRTLVAVGDGILIGRERVSFSILHTGVRTLSLRVPAGANVLEVSGDQVRDWRVKDDVLAVQLASEALGSQSLAVTYEKPMPGGGPADLPILRAEGAVRETGFAGVVALANVEISSPSHSGATPIDVRELPPEILGMTAQPVLLAWRYVGQVPSVQIRAKRHEDVSVLVTLVDSASLTAMQTRDGRRITKALYGVRNNRNQFLRLSMPAGSEIWSALVNGQPVRPAKDDQGQVLVPLVRSDAGSSELAAFPVELVYVERGADPGSSGRLRIELPTCAEPVTHLMASLYLPEEGSYSGFAGPLKKVEAFTVLGTLPSAVRVPVGNPEEARQLAAQVQERFERQAAAAGVAPIRVELPVHGKPFLFEKVLVLGDKLSLELDYSYRKGFLGL